MIASRLVRLIETHSDSLATNLMHKFLHTEALSELRKVPPGELRQRVYEVYHDLSDWLLRRTDEDIERCYSEIGGRRAAQHVPLSVVIAALSAVKHHLWEFVRREAFVTGQMELHQELELLQLVDQFFDRAIYFAACGHEKETAHAAAIREAVLARVG
jgi:hypothetical protein